MDVYADDDFVGLFLDGRAVPGVTLSTAEAENVALEEGTK